MTALDAERAPPPRSFVSTTLYLTAGLLIWAVNFMLTYVFAALACARGFAIVSVLGVGVVPLATGLACVVAALANIGVLRTARLRYRSRSMAPSSQKGLAPMDAFVDYVAGALAALSLVAVIWTSFVAGIPADCTS